MNNIEMLLNTLISMYGTKAYSFSSTTTANYVFLATSPTPALDLYVYNPSTKVIQIRTGDQVVRCGTGQTYIPIVKDLSMVSFKAEDNSAGTVVDFRYTVTI